MHASGLACLRCGAAYPLAHHAEDCPACRGSARANLTVTYAGADAPARPAQGAGRSMWRWDAMLPVARADAVSMGEGGTPLTALPRASAALGMRAVYAKDETRNPTWSFKDRLASSAISAARALGAKVIASSSSGNAGAAAAAYAARAGLPCVVFTFQGTAGPMVTQMRAYGAMLLAVKDKAHRWTLLERGVRELGWFPTSPFFGPAVGSNPLGVEGYKTLAYEIAEQCDWDVPEWCVLPVCYGDALIGMWKGFTDMKRWGWIDRLPRMVAAEVYGSLGSALAAGTDAPPAMPRSFDTVAVSIGAQQGTFQSLDAIRRSDGRAVTVGNEDMLRWQRALAAGDGLYGEPSAVAPLAALEALRRDGEVAPQDRAVILFTASGLKDPASTERSLPACPVVDAEFSSALRALEDHYSFDPRGGAAKPQRRAP
ncbi:MAG: pyridoxal-phosphate dependent enzyme [Burkholderiales bacterium]